MKHVKSIFLTALATFAFVACNNDEVVETMSPGNVPTGEETYASFNFRVEGNKTDTRVGMLPGVAGGTDAIVADGRLLIFDDASGALLNNEELTVSGPSANLTVKTTSGNRRIYIITGTKGKTQITGKLAGLAVNTSTLADFYALMSDGQYTGGADTDMGDGFKELPVADKFVMSNVADISAVKTLQPNISKEQSSTGDGEDTNVNRFDFNVLRAVARGNLKIELKQTSLTTADGVFTLKETATYGVRNVNRGTLYVQQFINDKQTAHVNDHSAEAGLRPFAAFYHAFDETSADDLKKPATYNPYYFGGYDIAGSDAVSTTMTSNSTGATAGGSVYFSENSNNNQVRGNTTYYGITTQVASIEKSNIAKSITYDMDLLQITSEAADGDYNNTSGDKSFWYLREIPAKIVPMLAPPVRRVFTDEGVAFNAVTIILKNTPIALTTTGFTDTNYTSSQLKASYSEAVNPQGEGTLALNAADLAVINRYLGYYKNGNSYYRLNLYETTTDGTRRNLVRRNHNYQATVTSFATIGDPTEEDLDKDTEKPVDADVTNVTAIIKVVEWHNVDMSDDL